MSVETNQREWSNDSEQNLVSKYEKCRNITEEIYKRINITFQIKKLEAGLSELSDNSEQIDSNELSNETDLFACDKSDISSSTEAEKPPTDCGKFININNNEERNKPVLYKRPKKRFRKRVKKRVARARSDSEGSSDEAPLSRIADDAARPPVLIVAQIGTVLKQKPEKRPPKKNASKAKPAKLTTSTDNTTVKSVELNKTLSVRIDKLPIKDVLSMADDRLTRNYRSFMRDNKLTIKSDTPTQDLAGNVDDTPAKDVSVENDKLVRNDEPTVKEEKCKNADWKNCSLCSCSFRGERGLRRHMSMSHILMPEDCK